MYRKEVLYFLLLLFLMPQAVKSQQAASREVLSGTGEPATHVPMEYVIEDSVKIYVKTFRTLYVYPELVFKSRRQERFYWRTVRDVKKALPYARLASQEINNLNRELFYLPDDRARKKHIAEFQKRVFREHEKDLRNLTVNQGKMLVKLIDREHDIDVYTLIKAYKGTMPATFWNTIARFWGSDLKAEYDGSDRDRIVERVVTLVDAGQL